MDTKIKELIYKARGSSRNMKQFAAEIGMSPAKLYRIAEGGFQKPVSDEDLEAIAEHAAEGSGVTFGLLKLASMRDDLAKHPEKISVSKTSEQYWEVAARRAVMEALYARGVPFTSNDPIHPTYFDFSMDVQVGDLKKSLYFEVKRFEPSRDVQDILERSIGRYVLNGETDGWYYVVFIGEPEERNDNRPTLQEHYIEHLRQRRSSLNISVLFINELPDRSYRIKEVCLRPEEQIIEFDY